MYAVLAKHKYRGSETGPVVVYKPLSTKSLDCQFNANRLLQRVNSDFPQQGVMRMAGSVVQARKP